MIPTWNGLQHMHQTTYPLNSDTYQWYIEEKYDGTSLSIYRNSFTNRDINAEWIPVVKLAVEHLRGKSFNNDYKYFGEAFRSARHNYVEYSAPPPGYFICYDIYNVSAVRWLGREELEAECDRLEITYSRVIYSNQDQMLHPYPVMKRLISEVENGKIQSHLGGIPEGLVLKCTNYSNSSGYLGIKKEREDLCEAVNNGMVHATLYNLNIDAGKFLIKLGELFATSARRRKAVQHLTERGLAISPRVIEDELDRDFDKEYKSQIMEILWNELSPIVKYHARCGIIDE